MSDFSPREQIVEIISKLFIYTDNRNWEGLQKEVFEEEVDFDISSLGGPNEKFTSTAICDLWRDGLKDIDSVNHLAGNYLVTISDDSTASVHAYATATHYKANAKNGPTREFVGTYDLGLTRSNADWRINAFRYQLKYTQGNMSLE